MSDIKLPPYRERALALAHMNLTYWRHLPTRVSVALSALFELLICLIIPFTIVVHPLMVWIADRIWIAHVRNVKAKEAFARAMGEIE